MDESVPNLTVLLTTTFAVAFVTGLVGFAGILTTIWCGMRGWPREEQRAFFRAIGVAIFAMSALGLGAGGSLSMDTLRLFLIGLPILLLASGVTLVV